MSSLPLDDAAPGNPFDLTGRVALVTGSSRGIGRTLAEGLAAAGATVVLNGVDPDRLGVTRAELAARFGAGRVHASRFDVTDEEQVVAAVAAVETEVGPVEVLVNNAGVQHRVAMLDLDLADWRRVVEVNLTSAFVVGRAVARGMVARGRGKIINVGSVQSDLARPTIAPYTATKGGIRNLTRAMAAEWGAAGVQANSLAPGYIHTEMTQNLVDDPAFNAWVVGRTPAGRWGRSADLVGPAVWLASAASDYVNGQTIFVDGGMTAVV
jgi:gluconate 5-dehydrogenase